MLFCRTRGCEKITDIRNKKIQDNPNYWKDRDKKSKKTRVANGHDPNWINSEQAKLTKAARLAEDPHCYDESYKHGVQTRIRKYGDSCNSKKAKETREKHKAEDPEFQAKINSKIKATKARNYGNPNYVNVEKGLKTKNDKYGDSHWNNPKKNAETCIDRYGHLVAMRYGSIEFKAAMKKKYGVEHNSQVHEFRVKQQQRYLFDGKFFESSLELAYYIWLRDHNLEFEYQPNASFWYEHEGKRHKYKPDFLVEGVYIELKGDHFFKEDGTMFLPYRKKSWTDEQYQRMCSKYESKHQCMLSNGVKIMRYSECKKYLEYVELQYGKNQLRNFKKQPKS